MTGRAVRRALSIAVAATFPSFPAPASAQGDGIEFLGAAGPGLLGVRSHGWAGMGATGAVTRWHSDHWGIAGSYWAVGAGQEREVDGPRFHHVVAPAIRWRRPMYGGRMTLHGGLGLMAWTNAFVDASPGEDFRLLPFPVVSVFVGVPVSPSRAVQAGGLWLGSAFLPTVGLAWTF